MLNVRDVKKSGRAVTGYIHTDACELLREKIFPVLTDDDVVKCIKFDDLIIKFGNDLCHNYSLEHQHDMIRAKLRLLGKFKLKMIDIEKNPSLQLQDMFVPGLYNRCIEALRHIASWDIYQGYFKHPVTAQYLSALIKSTCNIARSEFIKTENEEKEKKAERFLHLWTTEVPKLINKKADEDLANMKRKKKVILPTKTDIKLLYDYVKSECENCLKILDEKFNFNAWQLLTQSFLIFIQIFNRRRAGEIERLTIVNYSNKKRLNDDIDADLLSKFPEQTRECSKQFVRLTLRGKRSRTVSVLLSPFMMLCIETILKFRKNAGVKSNNEYIFSVPGENRLAKKYIRACPLMKRFADDCGAAVPKSLRETQLRKHIATHTALMNLQDCQVDQLANFMGHSSDIHRNIYRVPVPVTEITEVSKLLQAAIGPEDDISDGEEDEQDSNSTDEEQQIEDGASVIDNEGNSSKFQEKPAFKKQKISESSDSSDYNDEGSDDDSNHDEINEVQQSKTSRFKKRKSTLWKKIVRKRWTAEEKIALEQHFGNIYKKAKLPSLKESVECIKAYPILKTRSPAQIKAYIANVKSGNKFS
ncbi:uncharacterized protein LOC141535868 [Cotesia typhae]|uniref:uncharacterized protein LOC141535868 n=1 Tax=Cotesia typhae TaxID=2053667 RepID=UPI003D699AF3